MLDAFTYFLFRKFSQANSNTEDIVPIVKVRGLHRKVNCLFTESGICVDHLIAGPRMGSARPCPVFGVSDEAMRVREGTRFGIISQLVQILAPQGWSPFSVTSGRLQCQQSLVLTSVKWGHSVYLECF